MVLFVIHGKDQISMWVCESAWKNNQLLEITN